MAEEDLFTQTETYMKENEKTIKPMGKASIDIWTAQSTKALGEMTNRMDKELRSDLTVLSMKEIM